LRVINTQGSFCKVTSIKFAKYAVKLSRKDLKLGWPSYRTQYDKSAFNFAEDKR